MMRSLLAIEVLAVLVLLSHPASCEANDWDGVLDQLARRREAIKSLHHKYAVSAGSRDAMTKTTTETWELLTEAGRKRVTVSRDVTKRGDANPAADRPTKLVSDTEYQWQEMPIGSTLLVVKSKAKPVDEFHALRQLLSQGRARKRNAEDIAGTPCLVIECVGGKQGSRYKSTFWISQKYGLILKQVTESADGQRRALMTESLEVGKPLDAGMFAYAPPEGARVVDTLGMNAGK
ncbi:MAG: outer membrane lipoprotein carrier protein LolA [Phycisphaerae bacterium]